MKIFLIALMLFFFPNAALAISSDDKTPQNPFLEIPKGHWSYEIMADFESRGIFGTTYGLPPETPTTRFEMSSALARLLSVVDMTKLNIEDRNNLDKLIAEYQEELDALGVKVDPLDKRLAILEERLQNWNIGIRIRPEEWIKPWQNSFDSSHKRCTCWREYVFP